MSRSVLAQAGPAFTLLAILGATSGCAHAPAAVALRVEANVPDAAVVIDDVLVGKASDWSHGGRRVRAGFHRVEVRAPGYYSVYRELEQPDGGHAVIKAELHPLLD